MRTAQKIRYVAEPKHVREVTLIGARFRRAFRSVMRYLSNLRSTWGGVDESAREVFARLGLPEEPDLQLIDEYPRVSESRRTPAANAEWRTSLTTFGWPSRRCRAKYPPADT
jgi:hypothetical protein